MTDLPLTRPHHTWLGRVPPGMQDLHDERTVKAIGGVALAPADAIDGTPGGILVSAFSPRARQVCWCVVVIMFSQAEWLYWCGERGICTASRGHVMGHCPTLRRYQFAPLWWPII